MRWHHPTPPTVAALGLDPRVSRRWCRAESDPRIKSGEATVGGGAWRHKPLPVPDLSLPYQGEVRWGSLHTRNISPFSPHSHPALSSPHCLHTPAGRANRLVKGQMGRGCRDPRGTAEVLLVSRTAQQPESRRDKPKIPSDVARLCLTTH